MRNALVVIAFKGYQDVELKGVCHGLQAAGFHITLCGKEVGLCEGKFGGREHTRVAIRDAQPTNFDRICFIGGPGAHELIQDKEAHELATKFYQAGKIVGAICIAPLILAHAGLLQGRLATVWDSQHGQGKEAQEFISKGVKFTTQLPVVVDFPFVTGNGPNAAQEFGRVFAMV